MSFIKEIDAEQLTALEQLYEFTRDNMWLYDDNPPSVSCLGCGAGFRKNSKAYEHRYVHLPDCSLEKALKALSPLLYGPPADGV